MLRLFLSVCCPVFLFASLHTSNSLAHEGHGHDDSATHSHHKYDLTADQNTFSVDGKTYRWEHRPNLGNQSDAMIAAAKDGLHNNADRDLTTGEIVTVVAKHGLVTLDPKLTKWSLVEDQDLAFSEGMNSHGTDCFLRDEVSYWAFASVNTGEVVIAKRGSIVAKLKQPKGDEFDNPTVNQYFTNGGKFTPCDVVYLPVAERLVVVIGYAPGDYALSAEFRDGQWQWGGPAWGGSVNQGGMLSTGHGVEVATEGGQEIVEIASRSHGRVFAFTASGAQVRMPGADKDYFIQLPKGSTPCNISHLISETFLPLLNALPSTNNAAPVLMIQNGKPSGSLVPATYETLSYMLHMHGFCPVKLDGKLYGIALSWPNGGENSRGKRNDGQIAIFEAVAVEP